MTNCNETNNGEARCDKKCDDYFKGKTVEEIVAEPLTEAEEAYIKVIDEMRTASNQRITTYTDEALKTVSETAEKMATEDKKATMALCPEGLNFYKLVDVLFARECKSRADKVKIALKKLGETFGVDEENITQTPEGAVVAVNIDNIPTTGVTQ